MHATMRRAGWEIGRDQVGRLMRKAGLRAMTRGLASPTWPLLPMCIAAK